VQAVGASIRIFELLDRSSEVADGGQVLQALKGGKPAWYISMNVINVVV
jgi:hypothetical protein